MRLGCDLGEQCHRGFALLRAAVGLRRLRLALGVPSERLLSILLGVVACMAPGLQLLDMTIDQRLNQLSSGHLRALQIPVTVADVRYRLERVRGDGSLFERLQHVVHAPWTGRFRLAMVDCTAR